MDKLISCYSGAGTLLPRTLAAMCPNVGCDEFAIGEGELPWLAILPESSSWLVKLQV